MVNLDRLISELMARRGQGLPPSGQLVYWPNKQPGLAYAANGTTKGRIRLPADTAGVALAVTSGFSSLTLTGEASELPYFNLGLSTVAQSYSSPWAGAFDEYADIVITTAAGQSGFVYVTAFPTYLPPGGNLPPASPTQINVGFTGVNASGTATLAAAGPGLFHYITHITIDKLAANLLVASAAGTHVGSTNLNSWQKEFDTAADALGTLVTYDVDFSRPIRSAVANTATLFNFLAVVDVQWIWTILFYTGP